MKAILVHELGNANVLTYQDWQMPEPKANQVRIKTVLTSVNFADIKSRQGSYGKAALPFIPGLDATGIIDAVGSGVTGLEVGQRVAAYTAGGSYADYVLAEDQLCYPLSKSISFEQGAGIGILITAYNVLMQAGRFRKGDSVLVHAGAGGVGSTLIQVAKALGASKVFATVGSKAKATIAQDLGADEVINYQETNFADALNDLTSNQGVDLICDSIAGTTAEQGMNCLANFGRLVIYGHTSPEGVARLNSQMLHKQNRAVIGYSSGGFRKANPQVIQTAARASLNLLEQNKVNILMGERFKLKDANKAQELVENRLSTGKVILEP